MAVDRKDRVRRSGKVRVLRLLTACAIGYVLMAGTLYFTQDFFIFPGHYGPEFATIAHDATVHETFIDNDDGTKLFAYYKAPSAGMPTVVSFHGNGGLVHGHAARFMSGPWREHGWGFLAVAYRGFDRSTGTPSESAIIGDIPSIVRFARHDDPHARIVFHGISIGTAVAVAAAAQSPNSGLYLEAPMVSVLSVAANTIPFLPVKYLLNHPFRSDLRIPNVRSPIYIVHGEQDDVVPFSSGQALLAVAPKGAVFKPVVGTHMNIFGRNDVEAEQFFRASAQVAQAGPDSER
jgi:hypothetical protein